jgi:hypothetical protein
MINIIPLGGRLGTSRGKRGKDDRQKKQVVKAQVENAEQNNEFFCSSITSTTGERS